MPPNDAPSFRTLTGLYEPSGIQQLPDGRFIVVEDDSRQALSLISIAAESTVNATPLKAASAQLADDSSHALGELDDLEGVTVDRTGRIYAVTSHSRDSDGEEHAAREKLLRFRVDGERVVDAQVATGLKEVLAAAHPQLAAATKIRDVKGEGGFNIEGLTMTPDQRSLLVGFRGPLLDGRAIIACVGNPEALFAPATEPDNATTVALTTLDLRGNGIRGMSYVPALDGYLLIAGPMARAQVQFELWFWNGTADSAACQVTVAGLPGFEHAEGVSAALIDGRAWIVIVSDDGSRKHERFARFLLIDPAQLQIAR